MTERTPEYQAKLKAHLKELGYDPKAVDQLHFSSDQQAYQYGLEARQRVVEDRNQERRQNMAERKDGINFVFARAGNSYHVSDRNRGKLAAIVGGDQTIIDPDYLETLIAMKPLDKSLQEYIREEATKSR